MHFLVTTPRPQRLKPNRFAVGNFRQYEQIRGGKNQKRKEEEGRSEKTKSQKKEDAGARKGRKVAKHCVFQCFVAPEGRKVGSRAAGAEPSGEMRNEKLHATVLRSTFRQKHLMPGLFLEVKMWKSARGCLQSQNLQNTPRLAHVWRTFGS